MTHKLFGGTIRSALIHAATRYDERQSKKANYNHYALPQYFARIDDICTDIEAGATPREAIVAGTSGAVLAAFLRGIGETKPTNDELRGTGKGWTYKPVKAARP
jgi:hypothetical protein